MRLLGQATTQSATESRRVAGGQIIGLPIVPDTWVERPRLLARLDDATERALTLVIAPAGAGKTVTLARWARTQADRRVRWLNARQQLDVRSLGHELASATGTGRDAAVPLGPVAEQIAEVCTMLAPLRARDVVVIDDAHRLPHSCFLLLSELLDRCPGAVHVVLCTRWDPPLPLALLELQGDLSVVRGHQLRMTVGEARALLTQHAGPSG